MAQFDMKKLDTSDRIVVGMGVLTLICLFLPWYGVSAGPYSASVSGFSTSYGWLGAILIIIAAGYLAALRSGSNVPKISYGPGVTVLGLSAIGTIIVILRWITIPKGGFARLQLRSRVRHVPHDPRRRRPGGPGLPSLQGVRRVSAVGEQVTASSAPPGPPIPSSIR